MARPPQPGDLIADRYELEELVGTGGMSSVFRAYDRQLERRVAIKILHEHYADDPEYLERFRREARAVAKLSHPNIVTVIDRGDDDGRQYIVFAVRGDAKAQTGAELVAFALPEAATGRRVNTTARAGR